MVSTPRSGGEEVEDRLQRANNAVLREPVDGQQVLLAPGFRNEGAGQAESLEHHRAYAGLRQRLCDGTTQPAHDAVLLQRDDRPRLPRGRYDSVDVERLHGMHAQDPGIHTVTGEPVGDGDGYLEHGPGGDDGQPLPAAELDRLTEPKRDALAVDTRLADSPEAEIAGTTMLHHGAGRELDLRRVAGRDDDHPGQRAHQGEVLSRVVRHPQRAVGEPAPNRDDLHVRGVVAHVVADLLEAPDGGEIRDGVREDDLAGERHARRDARHRLLGDAGVDEAFRELLSERLDDTEAEVTHDQADARIGGGEL